MCTTNDFKFLSSTSPEQSNFALRTIDCDGIKVYLESEVVDKVNRSIQPVFFIEKIDESWLRGYYVKHINPSKKDDYDTFITKLKGIITLYKDELK